MRRLALCALVIAPVWALPAAARAQSTTPGDAAPIQGPIYMLNETATVTDVVDSIDRGSAFSFRLTAGYLFQSHTANIERERAVTPASEGGTVGFTRVGQYRETTHTFLANLELGLFHDLALTFGVPVVLSNSREIRAPGERSAADVNRSQDLGDNWTVDGMVPPTGALFSLPFQAPERSGIDQVRIGLSWAVLNQQRDRTKPTWLLHVEWRPPVGADMHACNANAAAGSAQCPEPSSIPSLPATGTNGMGAPTRPPVGGRAPLSPGISRGLHGLYFQTVLSRRWGYVEPYAGFDVLAEFPQRDTPFRYLDTPYGQLANFPPIVGSLVVGTQVTPWENRETWQRVVVDFRVRGTYRSQGRDYSVLYDALGSSASRALAVPGCPSNARNPDGSCQTGRAVYFDGLTGTASHAILGMNLTVTIQAAKFLRFNLGAGIGFATSHLVTNTDACNPNTNPPADHPEWRGGCVSNSAPDPLHRPVVDSPGGRFRTTDEMFYDLFASVAFTPRFF